MAMQTQAVTVKDNRGNVLPAQLLLCDQCGNDSFNLFVVEQVTGFHITHHNHMQCAECGHTFCDGSCMRHNN